MSTIEINFTESPAFLPIYKAALFGKRKTYRLGDEVPDMLATWNGAQADPEKLAGYRTVCGLEGSGTWPILYPHVLTSALHLAMMSNTAFPFKLLGAVHARNHCVQHQAIADDAVVDLKCSSVCLRIVKQGAEFDIATQVSVGGELVWEGLSTYLIRGKYKEYDEPPAWTQLPDMGDDVETATWKVPAGQGRRYAKVCGDYNPIHISKVLAKLFGFKRDLIHGMWSAAKSISNCPEIEGDSKRFDVQFKGPVFMESSVEMKRESQGDSHRFNLYTGGDPRPCLVASLSTAAPGEAVQR